MSASILHHPSSYRDPSGYIFEKDGILYRQVSLGFKEQFDYFIQTGFYNHLILHLKQLQKEGFLYEDLEERLIFCESPVEIFNRIS